MTTEVNIHDLVHLDIDEDYPWRHEWLSSLSDVISLSQSTQDTGASRLSIKFVRDLRDRGMRQLDTDLYVDKSAVFDAKYGLRLESPTPGFLHVSTNSACLEWLAWGLQLSLLAADATFIHGAGIAKGGKAVLFPSWGGVGKTSLVSAFVKARGWQLLGDDLVILSRDGTVLGFPKPMVLYPYHREIFPEVFLAGGGPIAPLIANSALTALARVVKPILRPLPRLLQFARKYNPQSVRVKPSEVFGQGALCHQAKVEAVIWLERVRGLDRVQVLPGDGTVPSRIMGSTLTEFDPRCIRVSNIAMGLGILRGQHLYSDWFNLLERGLTGPQQLIVCLPESLPASEVMASVERVLEDHGI